MVGHRSTPQSRVTVAVGYGGLPPCLDQFQAGRLGYMTKMSLTELCRVNPESPVKCREVTVKKKRVETFRNIRYGDGRIYYHYYYIYRQRSSCESPGGARSGSPQLYFSTGAAHTVYF